MSDICSAGAAGAAPGTGESAASGPAVWLGLAATPTFSVMAVLSAIFSGGPMDMMCSAGHASLIGGMVPMYLLMSAFHLPAWLKLIAERRRCVVR
jgi:hypothetical protein